MLTIVELIPSNLCSFVPGIYPNITTPGIMSVQLGKPYKISQHKLKRYADHYNIPSDNCVVVPVKSFGDDLSCEVRWEDANGELQLRNDLLFSQENIEPLNAFKDPALHELWQHYYSN
jgi:hypothetical protein